MILLLNDHFGLGLKFGVGFGWVNIDLMCCWGLFFCFGCDSQKWDDCDKEVFGVFVLVLLRRGRDNI